jgi:KipI family sensor histidine kinase inhibitor
MTVEFGREISPEINSRVRAFNAALAEDEIEGIVETVPTYCSVTVHYNPAVIRCRELTARFEGLIGRMRAAEATPSRVLELPVLYGGDMGPDMDFVCEHTRKSFDEIVALHSSPEYLIYMLGFTPGFTYLGGLNPEIETPRLKTPRALTPAGSVGIAGKQTGVYPISSPGGWQLIGRTPVKLYDPYRETPILPKAGDYIKFRPIAADEYERVAEQVSRGAYECRQYAKRVDG